MSNFKVLFICNALVRVAAFICITVAAIFFNKVGVLWFYLVPMFMAMEYKSDKKDEDKP